MQRNYASLQKFIRGDGTLIHLSNLRQLTTVLRAVPPRNGGDGRWVGMHLKEGGIRVSDELSGMCSSENSWRLRVCAVQTRPQQLSIH